MRLLAWAKSYKPEGWWRLAPPILSLSLLGLVAVKFPEVLGNGKDVVQLTLSNASTTSLLVILFVIRPLATAIILRSGLPRGGLYPDSVLRWGCQPPSW
ncbi:MAG: chloride channel protein [Janthinobacterium lividum]